MWNGLSMLDRWAYYQEYMASILDLIGLFKRGVGEKEEGHDVGRAGKGKWIWEGLGWI